jgi:hypothetical protein
MTGGGKAVLRGTCIPPNKVCSSLKLGYVDQIRLCAVALLSVAMLSWGEPKVVAEKVYVQNFCYCEFLHLPPPACGRSLEFNSGLVSLLVV